MNTSYKVWQANSALKPPSAAARVALLEVNCTNIVRPRATKVSPSDRGLACDETPTATASDSQRPEERRVGVCRLTREAMAGRPTHSASRKTRSHAGL